MPTRVSRIFLIIPSRFITATALRGSVRPVSWYSNARVRGCGNLGPSFSAWHAIRGLLLKDKYERLFDLFLPSFVRQFSLFPGTVMMQRAASHRADREATASA